MSRQNRELLRLGGYLLLSISYLLGSTLVESNLAGFVLLGARVQVIMLMIRIVAYLWLIFGLLLEPIEKRTTMSVAALVVVTPGVEVGLGWLMRAVIVVLAGAVALLYWRRGTVGLEAHVRKMAAAFSLMAGSEMMGMAAEFRDVARVTVYEWVAPFRWLWILEQVLLAFGVVLMVWWVWQYLIRRLHSQLYMIFIAVIMVVFLLTTVVFTSLLMRNFQKDVGKNLASDAKVMGVALETLKDAVEADARLFASDRVLAGAIENRDDGAMEELARQFLVEHDSSFVWITDSFGRVLVRGEDSVRRGDSLSDDQVAARALRGEVAASMLVTEGVVAPKIILKAAAPVLRDKTVVGAVVTGTLIDDGFVDEVKTSTGLEVAVYAGDTLAASTLEDSIDGGRWTGLREDNEQILEKVLEREDAYVGQVELLNVPFYAAYEPLKDLEGRVVGMLFVGKPQQVLFETAGKSIESAFVMMAGLFALSVMPAFLISRYITEQLR